VNFEGAAESSVGFCPIAHRFKDLPENSLRGGLFQREAAILRYNQRLANGIQSLAEPTCRQLNLGVGDLSVLDAETQVRRLCVDALKDTLGFV
jgi:hypothetical protein